MQGEHRRPTIVATLAAASLLAVAACTGPADPVPPASSTSAPSGSPTPSASPTPTALAEPELPAQVESVDGAVAMMRYVFELYTYAFATNDPSGFEPISAEDCTFCANVQDDVAANQARKAMVVGAHIDVKEIDARHINDHFYSGTAVITESPSQTVGSNGAVIDSDSAATTDVTFALTWAEGRWAVREVGAETAGDAP